MLTSKISLRTLPYFTMLKKQMRPLTIPTYSPRTPMNPTPNMKIVEHMLVMILSLTYSRCLRSNGPYLLMKSRAISLYATLILPLKQIHASISGIWQKVKARTARKTKITSVICVTSLDNLYHGN